MSRVTTIRLSEQADNALSVLLENERRAGYPAKASGLINQLILNAAEGLKADQGKQSQDAEQLDDALLVCFTDSQNQNVKRLKSHISEYHRMIAGKRNHR